MGRPPKTEEKGMRGRAGGGARSDGRGIGIDRRWRRHRGRVCVTSSLAGTFKNFFKVLYGLVRSGLVAVVVVVLSTNAQMYFIIYIYLYYYLYLYLCSASFHFSFGNHLAFATFATSSHGLMVDGEAEAVRKTNPFPFSMFPFQKESLFLFLLR